MKMDDFIKMLEDAGYKKYNDPANLGKKEYGVVIKDHKNQIREVIIGSGDGYNGFHGTFDFDVNGNFVSHGFWE